MKRYLFILFSFLFFTNAFALNLCEKISVKGTAEEKEMICRGLHKAQDFYTKFGFTLPEDIPPFEVEFKSKVILPVVDSAGNKNSLKGTRVLAMFDRGSRKLEFTTMNEPWLKLKSRTYFRLQYTPELYESVAMHEMMHVLNKSLYSYKDYGHAQDEYLAYAAQIYSLPDNLKNKVLNKYSKDTLFSDELSINDIVHFSNPHEFGVMSYRHFISDKGGSIMMNRIFTGDFKPIDLSI